MKHNRNIPIYMLADKTLGINVEEIEHSKVIENYSRYDFHRDDYYVAILIMQGSMEMMVDFQQITINEGQLSFTFPGQIHKLKSFSSAKGWLLSFDPKLISDNVKMILEQSLYQNATVSLDEKELLWFSKLMEPLFHMVEDRDHVAFSKQILNALMEAFGFRMAAIYLKREDEFSAKYSTGGIEIIRKFKQLLRHNFKTYKKPVDYAKSLNISVGYLNDSVRKITGFSTSYFIQQQILKEAMRLLVYSPISIKEIAFELEFEDPKYFYRFFKKATGSSPGEFRASFKF